VWRRKIFFGANIQEILKNGCNKSRKRNEGMCRGCGKLVEKYTRKQLIGLIYNLWLK
jgi:hypothetical protein